MTLSMEIRERIVTAHDKGLGTYKHIASVLGFGVASVSRILRRRRETGSPAPLPHAGGASPKIDARGLAMLKRWLEKSPDLTLEELTQRYNACKSTQEVSRATIGRAVNDRLGLIRKKRPIVRRKGTGRMSS
jgi:transposase